MRLPITNGNFKSIISSLRTGQATKDQVEELNKALDDLEYSPPPIKLKHITEIYNEIPRWKTYHRFTDSDHYSPYLTQYLFIDLRQASSRIANPVRSLKKQFDKNEVEYEYSYGIESKKHPHKKKYMDIMAKSFYTTLQNIMAKSSGLCIDDVKNIHRLCVEGYNLEEKTHVVAGEFKTKTNEFGINPAITTKAGTVHLTKLAGGFGGERFCCADTWGNKTFSPYFDTQQGVDKRVQTLIDAFNKEIINSGDDKDKKHTAICTLCQSLVLEHPFIDANTRSIIMVLFNVLLIKYGFKPALIPDPNMVDGISPEEFKQLAINGSAAFSIANGLLENNGFAAMEKFVNSMALIYNYQPKVALSDTSYFSGLIEQVKQSCLDEEVTPHILLKQFEEKAEEKAALTIQRKFFKRYIPGKPKPPERSTMPDRLGLSAKARCHFRRNRPDLFTAAVSLGKPIMGITLYSQSGKPHS